MDDHLLPPFHRLLWGRLQSGHDINVNPNGYTDALCICRVTVFALGPLDDLSSS